MKRREMESLMAIDNNYEKVILSMEKTFITDFEGIRYISTGFLT
ncbi:MAG: hypothetical protein K0S01_2620 [Herbinix sp.]|nr:hypothetical protein [Herbinix sp.]